MQGSILTNQRAGFRLAVLAAALLLLGQLLAIGFIYKHGIDFECRANWPRSACMGASGLLVSVYGILGSFIVFSLLFPSSLARLVSRAGERRWPLALNALGMALALVPVFLMTEGSGNASLLPTLLFWSAGFALLSGGILLFLAPISMWREFFGQNWHRLVPLLAGGFAAPLLATLIRPMWRVDAITGPTFDAVHALIGLLGYEVEADVPNRVIGAGDFFIDIAPVCSGIEGIALVTIFVTLYLFLFRDQLRFPLAFILYPIGIAISAMLNIVRIVILLAMGLNGNVELAVGGFHSHAGWLMFTIIAIGIIAGANATTFLQRDIVASTATTGTTPSRTAAPQPFLQDPMVARLLPFAVFMFSAVVVQALWQTPGLAYPLRAALVAATLCLFLPVYRRLDWRIDPVAAGVGLLIGLMWVAIPVSDPETAPPYGTLTGLALFAWFVVRGIGTIVLIPIVEELFFRDYLEKKFALRHTAGWKIGAAVATAILFAGLHDRWLEAFIAGLAFSYVARRSENITDAIISHAVANAVVYAAALGLGRLYII